MVTMSEAAMSRPGRAMGLAAFLSVVLIALTAVPSIWPQAAPALHGLKIDTDPENMLADDEPVRLFHNRMKAAFSLNDLIVVGVVQEDHPQGVFNPKTLGEVYRLSQAAETLTWDEEDGPAGVIAADIIAPDKVDNIDQAGLGSVSFNWLMPAAPETPEAAQAVRDKALALPMLDDTLVSGDGRALALYIPIREKNDSYRVAAALRDRIAGFDSDATYHITGLPIAQDQFGVEMFKQMAISAPAAMALILLLMWLFFRNLNLVLSPMVVAMVSVIGAMGLLIATGQTVHIMSSMIPIFVMPIAVLDAVHILSDFHDRYPQIGDRRKTVRAVMEELWRPMLFTTLTTAAGFASLAITPIPPVQVFGIFVALGVIFAWAATVTLVPAYIALMPERAFERFRRDAAEAAEHPEHIGWLGRLLQGVGGVAYRRARLVLALFVAAVAVAGYGISLIAINDNPVKWFRADHEIRIADRALNERFGGTYMAYLHLGAAEPRTVDSVAADLRERLAALDSAAARRLAARLDQQAETATDPQPLLDDLAGWVAEAQAAASDADWQAWEDAAMAVERAAQAGDVFKDPAVLRYVAQMQAALEARDDVGKTNALPDIVKTVHRELLGGEDQAFRIPDSAGAVAQTLITFQNSHRPQDLFKLVTPDYREAVVWLQLTSGDNAHMRAVVDATEAYMAQNPPPRALDHDWFGLTYINVVWQEKMVAGMAKALTGGFVAVLILMTLLFRSPLWGLLSMVPLTVTIALIYGVIGLVGKAYDMPVAVLSSLSLGLAVDYAIHFNVRSRQIQQRLGDWHAALAHVFGEPARAIARNVIVIGAGFTPLLAAPLVPYQTVGALISAILVCAGIATLIGLPALITLFRRWLFAAAPASQPAQRRA
ncbi:RND transporter [Rhodothalassium salexigens]|uniref:efflux RND transporter permease subunit n=1 Tax=Rhodothalassium salexigens TaxID=1086 RepID=UPI001914AC22|nr:MMPL family transporter [Rhodothalassium salexigens]MBK5922126.1 RND transporter [Rhodothalassium salexigens]